MRGRNARAVSYASARPLARSGRRLGATDTSGCVGAMGTKQAQLRLLLAPAVLAQCTTATTSRSISLEPHTAAVGTLEQPSLDAELAALAWQGLLNRAAPALYLRSPAFDAEDGHGRIK